MSVQAITCALALRGVSASEKLLLLALANYADEHMQCWPSQRRLAADTCLSDRTVRSLLAALEDRRLLSRLSSRRNDGSRSTDRITLHFAGEVVTGTERQPEIISGGGEMVSGGCGSSFRGVPEMVSGLTSFEPSFEPSTEVSVRRERPLAEFEVWYGGYPHKVGRASAEKAFPKARKFASLAELVVGLDRYVRTKPPDRSWCNPATWLNDKRWLDQPAPEPINGKRPDPNLAKLDARQANLAADFAGSEIAADEWRRANGCS